MATKMYIHERDKHEGRIRDIIAKSKGDINKQKSLATTQANRIEYPDKAKERAYIAKEMGYPYLEEVFHGRYLTLTETRTEKLDKILNDPSFWEGL